MLSSSGSITTMGAATGGTLKARVTSYVLVTPPPPPPPYFYYTIYFDWLVPTYKIVPAPLIATHDTLALGV